MGFSKRGPAGATGATGATGPQGPAGATGAAGTFDTIFQGAWSAGTYTQGQTVIHNNYLYVCMVASTSDEPAPGGSDWQCLANSILSGDVIAPSTTTGEWTAPSRGFGQILLRGSNAIDITAYASGISLQGGDGADGGLYDYCVGGFAYVAGGAGGTGTTGTQSGGVARLSGGDGGNAIGNTSAGPGGQALVIGGGGGGASENPSGPGGDVSIEGGTGGENTTSGGASGNGGNAGVIGGNAGSNGGGATKGAGGNATIDAGAGNPNGNVNIGNTNAVNVNIGRAAGNLGFHDATAVAKQTVSGARNNPEAALADLLTKLANLGLITNSTTAS